MKSTSQPNKAPITSSAALNLALTAVGRGEFQIVLVEGGVEVNTKYNPQNLKQELEAIRSSIKEAVEKKDFFAACSLFGKVTSSKFNNQLGTKAIKKEICNLMLSKELLEATAKVYEREEKGADYVKQVVEEAGIQRQWFLLNGLEQVETEMMKTLEMYKK